MMGKGYDSIDSLFSHLDPWGQGSIQGGAIVMIWAEKCENELLMGIDLRIFFFFFLSNNFIKGILVFGINLLV